MLCPRCGKDELSSDGICPSCNYRAGREAEDAESAPPNFESTAASQSGDKNAPGEEPASTGNDVPQWRKELTQRLADLKQKKESDGSTRRPQIKDTARASTPAIANINEKKTDLSGKRAEWNGPARESGPKTQKYGGNDQSDPPRQKTIASIGPEVYTEDKPSTQSDSKSTRELIDEAISRQSFKPAEEEAAYRRVSYPAEQESKLILLSRTLAGLIDLIFIVLCTGVFIISADYFSGIVMLDAVSLVEYSGLFLLIFFLYSIFFLSAAGQTVGMMITDLQITGIAGTRPSIGQLFVRCFGYLLSVAVLGVGLLWSLFDRNNLCFHDRISSTSIMRL